MDEVTMNVQQIPITDIDADDDFNCRGVIAPIDVRDLAQNIEDQGLLQPGVAVPHPEPEKGFKYKLIAGFRRRYACKLIGWKTFPCVIRNDMDDSDARIFNLNENIQREDLNIMQEALAIERIKLTNTKLRREDLANRLGKSAGWVQVRGMLLELPSEIQEEVVAGLINQTQIRELYTILLKEGKTRAYEVAREMKEAKRKGQAHKPKPTKKTDTKRQRRRPEIFGMMEYMSQFIPFEIENHSQLWSRCMSWCAGEISDQELYNSCREHSQELGLTWSDPSN